MGLHVIFTIELTAEDISLIGTLLDEQPYKKVAGLVQRVQAQITKQLNPAPSPVADKFIEAED